MNLKELEQYGKTFRKFQNYFSNFSIVLYLEVGWVVGPLLKKKRIVSIFSGQTMGLLCRSHAYFSYLLLNANNTGEKWGEKCFWHDPTITQPNTRQETTRTTNNDALFILVFWYCIFLASIFIGFNESFLRGPKSENRRCENEWLGFIGSTHRRGNKILGKLYSNPRLWLWVVGCFTYLLMETGLEQGSRK